MQYLLRTPKLLPSPKIANWGGDFLEWQKADFQIDEEGLPCSDFLSIQYCDDIQSPQAYNLSISENGILIECAKKSGARNALQTLRQIGMQADERGFRFVQIQDCPNIDNRVFSLDVSSGRILTLDNIKLLADRLSLFKYNALELQISKAYAFKDKECDWYGTPTLNKDDIKYISKYCKTLGLDLYCSIDTSIVNEKEMIEQLADAFDSDIINIENPQNEDIVEYIKSIGKTPIFDCKDQFRADAHMQLCSNFDKSKEEINNATSQNATRFILSCKLDKNALAPICSLYPQMAYAAACAWSQTPSEEAICEALDTFVFYDNTGDFARAILSLNRIINGDFIEKAFLANKTETIDILENNIGIDLDIIDGSADFAMALSATSKPTSRDSAILNAEFALVGSIVKWTTTKLRFDNNIESSQQKTMLKFIVSNFENIWLSRFEREGLWDASYKLRKINPKIFEL